MACATPSLVQPSGAAVHSKLRGDSAVSCSDILPLQEGMLLLVTPVRVRETPAFCVQLLARENIPGSSSEEMFPGVTASGSCTERALLACRGLEARAVTPDAS